LIVGTKDWSSWSLRPYLALRHIGVAFDEELVTLRRDTTSPEILNYSPAGRVPVLKIAEAGETTTVWDSLAICETLNDRHPDAKLWPDAPMTRARARAYAAEMHSGFADVRDQLSMDFVRRLPLPPLRDATKLQIARIIAAWSEALGKAGRHGRLPVRPLLDCRLHVRPRGLALHDLWRGRAGARARLYGADDGAAGDAGLGAGGAGGSRRRAGLSSAIFGFFRADLRLY
jgi:glutathione S-transferase